MIFSPFFAATCFTTSMICACGTAGDAELDGFIGVSGGAANSDAAPSAAASLRMKSTLHGSTFCYMMDQIVVTCGSERRTSQSPNDCTSCTNTIRITTTRQHHFRQEALIAVADAEIAKPPPPIAPAIAE